MGWFGVFIHHSVAILGQAPLGLNLSLPTLPHPYTFIACMAGCLIALGAWAACRCCAGRGFRYDGAGLCCRTAYWLVTPVKRSPLVLGYLPRIRRLVCSRHRALGSGTSVSSLLMAGTFL